MICEACKEKPAHHKHHKFPQTKAHRRHYGSLLEDPRNLQLLCCDCHLGKKKGVINWTELNFCNELKIKPRSKVGQLVYLRIQALGILEEIA